MISIVYNSYCENDQNASDFGNKTCFKNQIKYLKWLWQTNCYKYSQALW